jgi:hypothetical protein
VSRRAGREGLDRVVAELGPAFESGLTEPSPRAWYPVGAQLAITDAIIHTLLEGEAERLLPALRDDLRRAFGRTGIALLRAAGPRRLVVRAARTYASAYSPGMLETEWHGVTATLRYSDAEMVLDPTWQLLQRHGWTALFELLGHAPTAREEAGASGWTLRIRI